MSTVIYSTTHQSVGEEKSSEVGKEQTNLWIVSSVIYRKVHESVCCTAFEGKQSFTEKQENIDSMRF